MHRGLLSSWFSGASGDTGTMWSSTALDWRWRLSWRGLERTTVGGDWLDSFVPRFFWLGRVGAVARGRVIFELEELPPLVGSALPVSGVVSSI
jgi:hypothetical protein